MFHFDYSLIDVMHVFFIKSFPGERVHDITFWKTELNNEILAMENETDNLQVN